MDNHVLGAHPVRDELRATVFQGLHDIGARRQVKVLFAFEPGRSHQPQRPGNVPDRGAGGPDRAGDAALSAPAHRGDGEHVLQAIG